MRPFHIGLLGIGVFAVSLIASYQLGFRDANQKVPVIATECWTQNSAPKQALLDSVVTLTAPGFGDITIKHVDSRTEYLSDTRMCAYVAGWRWKD